MGQRVGNRGGLLLLLFQKYSCSEHMQCERAVRIASSERGKTHSDGGGVLRVHAGGDHGALHAHHLAVIRPLHSHLALHLARHLALHLAVLHSTNLSSFMSACQSSPYVRL